MDPETLALGPIWYVCFIFALTCHEAAHALAAKLGGDNTAYEGGQVSLNPWPHIRRSPFGTVVVPIVVFWMSGWMLGWANAPYDPRWQDRYPKRAALMALAGPAANFTLVIISVILMHLGVATGHFIGPDAYPGMTNIVTGSTPGVVSLIAIALSITFSLNLLLGVFNLIPVPPLDGSSAVGLFLPESLVHKYNAFCQNQAFALLGIVVAWRLIDFILAPIFYGSIAIIF